MVPLSIVLALSLAPAAQPGTGARRETEEPGSPVLEASQVRRPPAAGSTSAVPVPEASQGRRPAPASTPTPPVVQASQDPAAATPPATPAALATTPAPEGPPPDTQPVIRAAPGDWGMTFIFGGLGPLSVAGHGDQPLADGLIFTEIGVRRVFKRVVLPFSFGAGVTHRMRLGASRPEVAAGLSASVAVLKGFRVWRRIAPYFGGFLHTHYVDAPGPDNWLVNVSVGPILGIEYYLADRVSLYGQGVFAFGPDITRDSIRLAAQAVMAAGGQLGLTFYF